MPLPLVGAALAALATKLVKNGAEKLGGALLKGGAEKVEEATGLPVADIFEMSETPEGMEELKAIESVNADKLQMILDYNIKQTKERTARWVSDNAAGLLTKSIRPITLLYLLLVFTAFGVLTAFGIVIPEVYASGVRDLLYVAIGGYFFARTAEKIKGGVK